MATALTVYRTNSAAATLSTANQLYHAAAGTPAVNQTYTQIGSSLGFGEIYPQGNTNNWPAAGSLIAPDGHGYFVDDNLLDGQTIIAGNWSATLRLGAFIGTTGSAGGGFTADLYVRAFRYRAGVYTLIVSMVVLNQSVGLTITTYNLPNTAASSVDFAVGDRLYIQDDMNLLTNTGNASATVRVNRLSTATVTKDGDANAQIVTPGYQPTTASNTQLVVRQGRRSFGRMHP